MQQLYNLGCNRCSNAANASVVKDWKVVQEEPPAQEGVTLHLPVSSVVSLCWGWLKAEV